MGKFNILYEEKKRIIEGKERTQKSLIDFYDKHFTKDEDGNYIDADIKNLSEQDRDTLERLKCTYNGYSIKSQSFAELMQENVDDLKDYGINDTVGHIDTYQKTKIDDGERDKMPSFLATSSDMKNGKHYVNVYGTNVEIPEEITTASAREQADWYKKCIKEQFTKYEDGILTKEAKFKELCEDAHQKDIAPKWYQIGKKIKNWIQNRNTKKLPAPSVDALTGQDEKAIAFHENLESQINTPEQQKEYDIQATERSIEDKSKDTPFEIE